MQLSSSLIALLRCPENQQVLALADSDTLLKVNTRIEKKQLKNCGGKLVEDELKAALIRADAQRLYPIKDGFPIMLLDEAFDLL